MNHHIQSRFSFRIVILALLSAGQAMAETPAITNSLVPIGVGQQSALIGGAPGIPVAWYLDQAGSKVRACVYQLGANNPIQCLSTAIANATALIPIGVGQLSALRSGAPGNPVAWLLDNSDGSVIACAFSGATTLRCLRQQP